MATLAATAPRRLALLLRPTAAARLAVQRRCAGPAAASSRYSTASLAARSAVGLARWRPLRPFAGAAGSRSLCGAAPPESGLFIRTATTPNPESLKFVPGCPVLPPEFGSSADFRTADSARGSPLARQLFRVEGVKGVFLGSDFISITKTESWTWPQMRPFVFEVLMDFFSKGTDVISKGASMDEKSSDHAASEDDDEVVQLIKELLETRIRPSVQEDGGDIFFRSFDAETGVVELQLAGSCAGCPSSTVTLKSGVENMLCHYIPEVTRVDQVLDEEDETARVLQWNTDDHLPH